MQAENYGGWCPPEQADDAWRCVARSRHESLLGDGYPQVWIFPERSWEIHRHHVRDGIYLAECVSKSDEYARDDNGGTFPGLMAMLVCRCLVGKPHVVTEAGDAVEEAKANGCDCVCGDREAKVGTYKEYIFFDERSVVPEYAVIYKRQYDRNAVPVEMRQDATGVTGRNWQVRLDGGWQNFPADVSHELNQLEKSGGMTYDRVIGHIQYHFDLSAMTQRNVQSDKTRKIRAPMRR